MIFWGRLMRAVNPDGVYCPHIVFIDIYSSKDKVIIFA
jgi:hypothetical protein